MVWAGIKEGAGGAAKRLHRCCTVLCIPCRVLWAVYVAFVLCVIPFLVVVVFLQKIREVLQIVSELADIWANFTESGRLEL